MSSAHKRFVLLAIGLGILLYAGFNVWIYQYAKGGKTSSLTAPISPPVIPAKAGISPSTPLPTPTLTPRPTGPGRYACSPAGDCNLYGDEARKAYCTHTYADSSCLDQCGEKTKLCTK